MGPEFWIALGSVFVAGGAIGSAGTLLAQWILKKVDNPSVSGTTFDTAEKNVLAAEVAEMGRQLRNLDARLDFTEQLLGGALPLAPPPERLSDVDDVEDDAEEGAEAG